jgi:hypothetical protein
MRGDCSESESRRTTASTVLEINVTIGKKPMPILK